MPDDTKIKITAEDKTGPGVDSIIRTMSRIPKELQKDFKEMADGTVISLRALRTRAAEQQRLTYDDLLKNVEKQHAAVTKSVIQQSNLVRTANVSFSAQSQIFKNNATAAVAATTQTSAAIQKQNAFLQSLGSTTQAHGNTSVGVFKSIGQSIATTTKHLTGLGVAQASQIGSLEGLRRAYMDYAKFQQKLSQTGMSLGIPLAKMEKDYADLIKNINRQFNQGNEEIADAFRIVQEKMNLSSEDAARILPTLAATAKGAGVDITTFATTWATAMRNMNVPIEESATVMNSLSYAARVLSLDINKLSPDMAHLTEVMAASGYKGADGIQRALVYVKALGKATGDTNASARLLTMVLEKAATGDRSLEEGLGFNEGQMNRELKKWEALGHDRLAVLTNWIATSRNQAKLMEVFGIKDQRFWRVILGDMDKIGGKIKDIKQAEAGATFGDEAMQTNLEKVNQMLGTMLELSIEIGAALDAMGITSILQFFTSLVVDLGQGVKRARELGEYLGKLAVAKPGEKVERPAWMPTGRGQDTIQNRIWGQRDWSRAGTLVDPKTGLAAPGVPIPKGYDIYRRGAAAEQKRMEQELKNRGRSGATEEAPGAPAGPSTTIPNMPLEQRRAIPGAAPVSYTPGRGGAGAYGPGGIMLAGLRTDAQGRDVYGTSTDAKYLRADYSPSAGGPGQYPGGPGAGGGGYQGGAGPVSPIAPGTGYGGGTSEGAKSTIGGAGPAQGPVAPGSGGGVPSAILAQAQQAAVAGGPGAVDAFMRAQGYPRNGAWCGSFAASCVKAAGGTPPANPQIASNWRNFGTEVSTPQPGDIAVRRGARTGSTGSHVTFVSSVGKGTFAGLGGNQGGGRLTTSNFGQSGYQFFRGAGPEAQPGQQAALQPAMAYGDQAIGDKPGGAGWTPSHFASVRYNNPGAQYPGASSAAFGSTGYGIIGGGHKIAQFPTAVHGAASNMNLLMTKYTGMTVAAAMRKWSGGSRAVTGPSGNKYDPNMVITPDMARDPNFAISFMKSLTSGEAPGKYPLTDPQWQQAHQWAMAGRAGGTALAGGGIPRTGGDGRTLELKATPEQLARATPMRGAAGGNADQLRRMGFVYDPDTGKPLRQYDPYTGAKLSTAGKEGVPGSAAGGVHPGIAAAKEQRDQDAHNKDIAREKQLRKEISETEIAGMPKRQRRHGEAAPAGGGVRTGFGGEPIRVSPRTRGVGGEAAPRGGARPGRSARDRAWRGRVSPRTPGVGGEAAPEGGMPEPVEVAQERRFRELREIEERKKERQEREERDNINQRAKRAGQLVGRPAETEEEKDEKRKQAEEREASGREARRRGALSRGEDPDVAEKEFQEKPKAVPLDQRPGRGGTKEEKVSVNMKVNDSSLQFARNSMRQHADREVREARNYALADTGAA